MRPISPTIPFDLQSQFGETEHAFGPNMRFRTASLAVGGFLVLIGASFFAYGLAVQGDLRATERPLMLFLGGGVMTVGVAAVVLPRRVPRNWVFVCQGGLVRTRGAEWDGVSWSNIARLDEMKVGGAVVVVRQLRIITTDGEEWGFLADYVADFGRLTAVLRQKVDTNGGPRTKGGDT